MGDISVIIEGREAPESASALYSTVHGAGRVMSRTRAAGRKRWRKGRVAWSSAAAIEVECDDGAKVVRQSRKVHR